MTQSSSLFLPTPQEGTQRCQATAESLFQKFNLVFFLHLPQLLLENNQPHLLSHCPLLLAGVTVWSAQKFNTTPFAFKIIVLMTLIFRAPEPVKINLESVFETDYL